MKSLILALSFVITTTSFAQSTLATFKKSVQEEIVKGMLIANGENNPIVYGEQGGGGAAKGQLDTSYWKKTGNYTFEMRPGVNAAKAVESIFPTKKTQKEVKLECHSMMIAIIYRAIMKSMGEDKFNKVFKKITIKSGDLKASGLEKFFAMDLKIPKSKLEAGDWVYFKNNESYLSKHPDGAWQGENAIYVGKKGSENIYSGFGAEDLTEKGMLKELLDAYNEKQTEGDKEILDKEWKVMLAWLKKNTVHSEGNYFQLSSKLFKVPRNSDPDEDLDKHFEPVAKGLGYKSVEEFSSEWDYEVEEVDGLYLFSMERISSYEDKLTVSDIPGLKRIDRLDYAKLFKL